MSKRSARQKIKTRQELQPLLERLQQEKRRVVFTNGCFDLLHPGHIRYLEQASRLGDVLVVAVNSDASVRRLKGPRRPVLDEHARQEILAALEVVDWVTTFAEDTPAEIIREFKPDVLVKGGDWPPDQIVGREDVEASGGEVISIPFQDGFSTSSIIRRIRDH